MAIRINRGRPSLKNIKAKYRKKYGADWFNKKTAMAAYRREVAGKKASKSKTRAAPSSKKSSKGLTAYQFFVQSYRGRGWSMAKIADEWRKQGKPDLRGSSTKRSSAKRSASKPASKGKLLRAKYRKAYGNDWWQKKTIKARYDKGLAPLKKTASKSSKSSKSRAKSKGKNSLTQLGITLKRLGYKGKITGMSIPARQKKIKSLRAKGRNEKAFEGIARAKTRRRRRR